MTVSVLFVCMGNICRSPMAEGVFRKAIEAEGLSSRVEIDSAGTHAYHVGEPPDPRAQSASRARGIDLSGLRARKVNAGDFARFDYILCMDGENLRWLREHAPEAAQGKIHRLMDFSRKYPRLDVVDPYYGGAQGFEENLDMIEDAVAGLIAAIRASGRV